MAILLIPPPIQTINMRIYKPPYKDIDYPRTIGMHNIIVQQKINESIYDLLLSMFQILECNNTSIISTAYEIKTNQNKVLSLVLTGFCDNKGSQLNNCKMSINIDCDTGKSFILSDLFTANSNYIEKISEIILEQINERRIQLTNDFKGITSNQNYYIADLCLVIYFQQNEITPVTEGYPRFAIPLYSLQELISENSILHKLLI